MPMYLVLGPTAAGKTTLIQESGPPSALTDSGRKMRGVRGAGGARSFQWFFTEQAILLDMSGKALKMSEFDDNEDWVQFLGSLRKMRPERPINGVVVAVPVSRFASGGPEGSSRSRSSARARARSRPSPRHGVPVHVSSRSVTRSPASLRPSRRSTTSRRRPWA